MKLKSSLLTFVIQGSIKRKEEVKQSISSVRFFFPDSKIILSTWEGSDYSNLDFDELVLSKDTPLVSRFYKNLSIENNINRQIISTINGLRKVHTKFAAKIRTDIVLKSDNLLKILTQANERSINSFFSSKIIIPYDLSVNPYRVKLLFHFNDWFVAGRTSDLRKLYNIPLMSMKDLNYNLKPLKKYNFYTFKNWINNNVKRDELKHILIARFIPEQYIFKFAALKKNKLDFKDAFSFNRFLLNAHNKFAEQEILFESSKDIAFICLKHKTTLFTDLLANYTKSYIDRKNKKFNFPDLRFFYFKSIQLAKLLIYKFSKKTFHKIKCMYESIL